MITKTIKEAVYKIHADCGHLYDGYPYRIHLELAYNFAMKWIHKLTYDDGSQLNEDTLRNIALAVLMHDTIEDCRMTYNDVYEFTKPYIVQYTYGYSPMFNPEIVADIVYALTNEKGKNRKERANDKYYDGIRNTEFATFVKLCDRYANVLYSKMFGSRMFKVYEAEHTNFVYSLNCINSDTIEGQMANEIAKLFYELPL